MGRLSGLSKSGDFLKWRAPLRKALEATCPGDGWRFQLPTLRMGHGLFQNSISNVDNARVLGNVLRHDEDFNTYYFKQHLSSFVLIFIGGLLLVASIFAAVAINRRFRGWVGKWCWGKCRQRTRVRMKAVPPHRRGFLVAANSIACLLILIGASFTFSLSIQGIQGVERSVCSMWMEVYGHFFGTREYAKSQVEEVAMTWSGTQGILDQLGDLEPKVVPTDDNPILQLFLYGYEDLKTKSYRKGNETSEIVQNLAKSSRDWTEIFNEASGQLSGVEKGLWTLPTAETAIAKSAQILHELDETLQVGWNEIERLLAEYAGPDSALMRKASAAVVDTIQTVRDVDLLAAELANTWSDAEHKLDSAVKAVLGISTAIAIIGIIGGVGLVTLSVRLMAAIKADTFPVRRERQFWATQYVILVVLAGLTALTCGLNYTGAVIGWDACYVGDRFLVQEGEWDLLPDHVLSPKDDMHVDVRIVLDTCVREDGTGDVASSLALDGRIAELADDVEIAKADVWATRDAIVSRKEKTIKASVLRSAYRDLLETNMRRKPNTPGLGLPVAHSAFNGTEYIMMDWIEAQYLAVNEEDTEMKGLYDGFKSILCIVPYMSTGGFLKDCVGQTLQFNVVPVNVALDRLNEEAGRLHTSLPSLKQFPTHFCSETAILEQYGPCAEPQRHIITKETFDSLPIWVAEIQSAIDSLPEEERAPFATIGQKFADLITQLINIEELRGIRLEDLNSPFHNTVTCGTDNSRDCPLIQAKTYGSDIMATESEKMLSNVLELLSLVDKYVDDLVTPTMDSLVYEANQVSEGANCQFEGTAIRHGVLPPLCQSTFPAFALLSIISGVASVIFGLMAIHTWKWYHYMEDIAEECNDDALAYEVQKMPTALMSARPEFVALYTGIPGSPKVMQRLSVETSSPT